MEAWISGILEHETAYEVRISDWSSDVCSSDLLRYRQSLGQFHPGSGLKNLADRFRPHLHRRRLDHQLLHQGRQPPDRDLPQNLHHSRSHGPCPCRSEKRSVGQASVSTFSSRLSPLPLKQKAIDHTPSTN